MRYALRNQEKIKQAYDAKILARIIASLDAHFKTHPEIATERFDGESRETLIVNDIGHSVNVIAFYVLEIKYDVYRLAFREFIG